MLRELAKIRDVKEAPDIKVPSLPGPSQFRAWKGIIFSRVNSAAGRKDDKALRWIQKVEAADATMAQFRKSGKSFYTLDRKLGTALGQIASSELGREMTRLIADTMKGGRSVTGRELLFMIFQYYATGKGPENMYDLTRFVPRQC